MTAAIILTELQEARIRLSLHGDGLRLEGPRGAIWAALRDRLEEPKPAIVEALKWAQTDTREHLLRL